MDGSLLCALLLLCAPGNDSRWGLGGGHPTVGPSPLSWPREAVEATPTAGEPLASSLQGPPLVDRPLLAQPLAANDTDGDWGDPSDVAWTVVLVILFFIAFGFLCAVFCGTCIVNRIRASLNRARASNNIVLRALNRRSSDEYGVFEATETQIPDPDVEGSQETAAPEDPGARCTGTPDTIATHRERTDSEITLEANYAL